MKVFAAIDVGSYELAMKIFTIQNKTGMKQIDDIRHRIELGTDTFMNGKISYAHMDELCNVLLDFKKIMDSYKVDAYKAYATSAIREAENTTIILDQIKIRTGFEISVLSNSEQRFLDYKAIASRGEAFEKIISEPTAIVDIGGSSIQVSIFENESLITTQNLRLGILRLRDRLYKLQPSSKHYEELLEEVIDNQLMIFKKMFLGDKKIHNIIVVDDYVSVVLRQHISYKENPGYSNLKNYLKFVEGLKNKNTFEIAKSLGIGQENASLMMHSAILVKRMMEVLEAKLLWAPGVTITDGIAYEYAQKNKLIVIEHDFEKDILACVDDISKRYMGEKERVESMENIALTIFDSMKKIHGLGKRERLLLQIAVKLFECGKYISLTKVGECSYSIIMATEIIGISHVEREIIANVVRFNRVDFSYYDELGRETTLDKQSYLVIAKLTAILRVANGLDRSHKQKFRDIKATVKENQLVLTVDTTEDITLEKGLLIDKINFFEEVFSIVPMIKQKNSTLRK